MKLLGLFAGVKAALPRILPLFRDPAVPSWLKAVTVTLALVIVSPIDLFGDIPILGWFDDAALLALLATGFVTFAARFRSGSPVRQEQRVGPPALR